MKKIPMRKCIGCGEMKEKTLLCRVIRTPENEYKIDETGRLSGRGAYVCKNKECLSKAIKSHGLERSFQGSVPKEAYDALQKELEGIS